MGSKHGRLSTKFGTNYSLLICMLYFIDWLIDWLQLVLVTGHIVGVLFCYGIYNSGTVEGVNEAFYSFFILHGYVWLLYRILFQNFKSFFRLQFLFLTHLDFDKKNLHFNDAEAFLRWSFFLTDFKYCFYIFFVEDLFQYSPGWPWTQRAPPASTSQGLGWQAPSYLALPCNYHEPCGLFRDFQFSSVDPFGNSVVSLFILQL